MLRCLTLLTVLCAFPAVSQAAWTCESAHNLAENGARLYVSQVFAKVQRGETSLERAHMSLLFVMARQGMRPSEPRENKLCYYQGLWQGLTDQLAIEYGVAGLSCLGRSELAAYAGAILQAIAGSLKPSDAFDQASLSEVFRTGSESSAVPWCAWQPPEACAAPIREQAGSVALDRYGALVDPLAAQVCGEPPPELAGDAGPPEGGAADAAVEGEADAGVSDAGMDAGVDGAG